MMPPWTAFHSVLLAMKPCQSSPSDKGITIYEFPFNFLK